jgi:hypothetical protein
MVKDLGCGANCDMDNDCESGSCSDSEKCECTYEFCFDNQIEDDNSAEFNDRFILRFVDELGRAKSRTFKGGKTFFFWPTPKYCYEISTTNQNDITRIDMGIFGNGALMIDQAIFKMNDKAVRSWGIEDKKGFCMSTDKDDFRGTWGHNWEDSKYGDSCDKTLSFYPKDGEVKGDQSDWIEAPAKTKRGKKKKEAKPKH